MASATDPDEGPWSHHPHLPTPTMRTGREKDGVPYLANADRWKWRRKIRQNPHQYFWYRIAVAIAGVVLMALGPITSPLPGPGGTALFLMGLAVLASEFHWARRFTAWFHPVHNRYLSWPKWRRVLFWFGIVAVFWVIGYIGLVVVGIPKYTPDWLAAWLTQLPGVR